MAGIFDREGSDGKIALVPIRTLGFSAVKNARAVVAVMLLAKERVKHEIGMIAYLDIEPSPQQIDQPTMLRAVALPEIANCQANSAFVHDNRGSNGKGYLALLSPEGAQRPVAI